MVSIRGDVIVIENTLQGKRIDAIKLIGVFAFQNKRKAFLE